MNEERNINEQVREWVSMVADEILSEDNAGADVNDLVSESTDGSEWVIYYAKSYALVFAASDDEQENAYAEARDSLTAPTYANLQTAMAYYILRDRLSAEVNSRR
jgi:hypothetical protein